MTVLITGANSYIGKNLILFLKKKKIKYYGIDIKPNKNLKIHKFDISNEKFPHKFKSKSLNTIIHLAAMSNENLCKQNEKKAYEINVLGTMNVINLARQNQVKKFLFASSEWVYEASNNLINSAKSTKIDFTKTSSIYAKTKILGEDLIKNSGLNYCIMRFGIVYGKRGKSNPSAVENLYLNIYKKGKVKILSKISGRSFIYIEDLIKMIVKCNFLKEKKITLDLQGPKFISIYNLAKIIFRKLNKKENIIIPKRQLHSLRKINASFSNRFLKITKLTTISDGINKLMN